MSPTRESATLQLELTCPWCVAATIEVLTVAPHIERVLRRPGSCVLDVTHTAEPGTVLQTIAAIGPSIEVGSCGVAVVVAAKVPVARPCHRHQTPEIASATPTRATTSDPRSLDP